MLLKGNLHYLGQDKVFKHCLDLNEAIIILIEPHKGVGGGHFFVEITIKNL
jgi:hypothetical protein